MDIPRYNVGQYKRVLGDLAKYDSYVQSFTETKLVEGNRAPTRVYQITILEPEAVNLDELRKAKLKKDELPAPESTAGTSEEKK